VVLACVPLMPLMPCLQLCEMATCMNRASLLICTDCQKKYSLPERPDCGRVHILEYLFFENVSISFFEVHTSKPYAKNRYCHTLSVLWDPKIDTRAVFSRVCYVCAGLINLTINLTKARALVWLQANSTVCVYMGALACERAVSQYVAK
jgi:hypothetical protein